MFIAYKTTRPRYQASVYKTIGPLVSSFILLMKSAIFLFTITVKI